MTNVAKRARRYMAGTNPQTGESVYPEYISFETAARPAWWRDDVVDSRWGTVLGVHEYEPGKRADAFVVTEDGLALFEEAGVVWLPYVDMDGWDRLFKEPVVSTSLTIRRKDGRGVEFKFPRFAQAFAFVQFIGRARWEHEHDRRLREAASAGERK